MLTSPAAWLLLVSLSMVTLLRLRSPELLIETSPDWVSPVSICISSPQDIVIVTCSLVIMDESLI